MLTLTPPQGGSLFNLDPLIAHPSHPLQTTSATETNTPVVTVPLRTSQSRLDRGRAHAQQHPMLGADSSVQVGLERAALQAGLSHRVLYGQCGVLKEAAFHAALRLLRRSAAWMPLIRQTKSLVAIQSQKGHML